MLERLDWLKTASSAISKNPRRSIAMIAGIILGTLILSSIIIYSSVLQQQNFESIVASANYEVSFTNTDKQYSEGHLWELGTKIADDPRVSSYSVVTGASGSIFSRQNSAIMSAVLSNQIGEEKDANQAGPPQADFSPYFVRDNFTQTSIYDKVTSIGLEGVWDLSGLSVNKTIIPRSIANKYGIEVGDIIDHINVTLTTGNSLADLSTDKLQILNVTVMGIYSTTDVNSGAFSSFNSPILYLNTELLDTYGSKITLDIQENSMYFLAVKINPDQFTTTDLDTLNAEIDQFINDITKLSIDPTSNVDTVAGTNEVSSLLLPFSILNIFLIVFDIILILPLVILFLYLLIFGLQLSLEERRREIGIFKVQGADSKQIFGLLRNESFLLFIIGTGVGYILSTIGAWIIASAVGFMEFNINSAEDLSTFLKLDYVALFSSLAVIFIILAIAVYKKGREFINLEVSEAVQKGAKKEVGFMRRNGLDIIFMGYGLISAAIIWLNANTNIFDNVSFNPDDFLWGLAFRFLGTIALWVGGAVSGARVAKWLPQKFEKQFLNLPKIRNVGLVIRSGLKRRGDIDRLVVIIVLTLSIATLAAIQGYSDQLQIQKGLEYDIGADFKMTFTDTGNHTDTLLNVSGVQAAYPLPQTAVSVLSLHGSVFGYNPSTMDRLIWHDDSFNDISSDKAIQSFQQQEAADMPGILLGSSAAANIRSSVGDIIKLKVEYDNPVANQSIFGYLDVKVVSIFDHAPGGVSSSNGIVSYHTIETLRATKANTTADYSVLPESRDYFIMGNATVDPITIEKNLSQLNGYTALRNLDRETSEIGLSGTYGVPGLLTMMFLTAFAAALVSAFAFSAIIMERRKREFAVLQTVGASSGQIYTIAFGENFLIMLTSVIWGIITGVGLSFLMNAIFGFISDILGKGGLTRIVYIPWVSILINGGAIFAGMLIATLFSVRSSVRQDLTEATRNV